MEGVVVGEHGGDGGGRAWRAWWWVSMEGVVVGEHGGDGGGRAWRGWWWVSMEGVVAECGEHYHRWREQAILLKVRCVLLLLTLNG